MKDFKLEKIIDGFVLFVELLLLSVPIILENLYNKKMGIKRHMMNSRMKFSNGVFSQVNLSVLKYALIILIILFVLLLIYKAYKGSSIKLKINIAKSLIISIMGLASITMNYFLRFNAYYYFLVIIFIIILLEALKAIGLIIWDRNSVR